MASVTSLIADSINLREGSHKVHQPDGGLSIERELVGCEWSDNGLTTWPPVWAQYKPPLGYFPSERCSLVGFVIFSRSERVIDR